MIDAIASHSIALAAQTLNMAIESCARILADAVTRIAERAIFLVTSLTAAIRLSAAHLTAQKGLYMLVASNRARPRAAQPRQMMTRATAPHSITGLMDRIAELLMIVLSPGNTQNRVAQASACGFAYFLTLT